MEESEGNVVYLNTVAAIPQKIVDAKEKELQIRSGGFIWKSNIV